MGNLFQDTYDKVKDTVKNPGKLVDAALDWNPVTGPLLNPKSPLNITGGKPLTGAGSVLDINKPARDTLNAAQGQISTQKQITDALGMSELGQYKTALAGVDQYDPNKVTLSAGEKTILDTAQHSQQVRVNALMAKLGLSNSTMAASMLNQIDTDRVISETGMLNQDKYFVFQQKLAAFQEANTHYQNALQALGISNSLMQQSMQINEQYSNQIMQEWTALIGAAATIGGAAIGGPGGAAAGSSLAKAGTSGMTNLPSVYSFGNQSFPTVQ